MKKLLFTLILVSTISSAVAGTLAQARQKVDDWLADKWPIIAERQNNYFLNRGVYCQGLRTHTIIPAYTSGADGDSVADQLNANPTDQFSNWSNVFPEWEGVAIPCALKCDVYDSPEGKGWVATVYVRYNGVVYKRSRNVGPESFRTKAWAIAFEEP